MLLFAKLFGEIFTKLKQPAIIGEILAGIFLGPTILGMIFPDVFNWLFSDESFSKIALDGITTLAVILLLLVSGLEVDLSAVLKHRKTAVSTGVVGIIVPFILGAGITYLYPDLMGLTKPEMRLVFSLFIGTAIAISSLPVIAKILIDLKIFKSKIGFIIISAAMLNDVIGWLIFSVILGTIGAELHGFTFIETLLLILVFIVVVLFIIRRITNRLIPWIQNNLTYPGTILNFILILGFLGAAFTEYIGIHAILGAFILGIAIGDSVHLTERTREVIQQFVTNIFAPLFFVSIGLRVNFITNFELPIVLILLGLAFVGKVSGCGLGAYIGGLKKKDALAVGFGMSSSGAMGIIIGLLALQYGLIPDSVFIGLVIMALVTSMTSAPLLNYFLKERKKCTLENLVDPQYVFYTDVDSKDDIIKFLSAKAEQALSEKSLGNVHREELFNSIIGKDAGTINQAAVFNAEINIAKPFLAIAINKNILGKTADGFRIVVFLLIPKEESELQLKLLSEITNKFNDNKKVFELLSVINEEEFVKKMKE
jgi:Kef-type K+ transport system membrane component KefB/mannitol/fructose-specific phosphotransferase system IIA component (Ntr-type)